MSRSTKDAWLKGPGDLKEADVTDVPEKGSSVRVRGLAAAFSNQATSEATEWKTVGNDSTATINKARMEVIQFAHGVIEPQFTLDEAQQIAEKYGPAFRKVVDKIDELSGVNKEAVEEANARFQGEHEGESPANVGNGVPDPDSGPVVHVRAGAGVGNDSE